MAFSMTLPLLPTELLRIEPGTPGREDSLISTAVSGPLNT